MKKGVYFFMILGSIFLGIFTGCGKKDAAAQTTLVMATHANFPPFEYKEGTNFAGIDVDIAKRICEKLGYTLKVEDMEFPSIIPAVQSGKADLGAAGMTVKPERLKNVDFSIPYYTATQAIIVKKDSVLKAKEDLKDKRIAVQNGTVGETSAVEIVGKDNEKLVQRFTKGPDAVSALLQNKVDAVIIDQAPAEIFIAKNSAALTRLMADFAKEEYAIAVKKGNTELLNKVNAVLREMLNNGEIAAIISKYQN